MKNKLIAAFALASSLLSSIAFADDEKSAIEKAQTTLNATFSNWKVSHFGESPIPGIYEIHSGAKVIYFHSEKGILIFGRMVNGEGEDLTQLAINKESAKKMADLPLKDAVTIQKGKIPLIEITNPDCGFCHKYDSWITELSKTYSIERKIIYMENQNFPDAKRKIGSVFCAKDKAKAYSDMKAGNIGQKTSCKEADAIFKSHERIVESLGVSGTPSFLLPNGSIIVGFKPAEIEQYLVNSTKSKE